METSKITVAYVNPRDGKRPPNIKTTDNVYYGITDEMFQKGMLQKGGQYEIAYTTTESQDGRQFKNVRAVKPLFRGPTPPAPTAQSGRKTDPQDAEQMWASNALRGFIEKGDVVLNVDSLANAEVIIKQAHKKAATLMIKPVRQASPQDYSGDNYAGPPPGPEPAADDFDDEIPF